MSAYENLLKFWREYPVSNGGIHPKDIIPEEKVAYIKDFSAYIKSKWFFKNNKVIHSGLLPSPYCGNIEKARVYFLSLNPGFSPCDYFAEAEIEFRNASLVNLTQKGRNLPFLPIVPSFCWTSGAEWWRRKLAPIFRLYLRQGMSYLHACNDIVGKIASLEIFPYHSAQFGGGKSLFKIESVARMKDFARNLSRDQSKLLIVLRKASEWDLEEADNVLLIPRNQARKASIGPFEEKIFMALRK